MDVPRAGEGTRPALRRGRLRAPAEHGDLCRACRKSFGASPAGSSGAANSEIAKPETVKAESAIAATLQPEVAKPEIVRSDTAKLESARLEAARAEAARLKAEAARQEAERLEAVKTEERKLRAMDARPTMNTVVLQKYVIAEQNTVNWTLLSAGSLIGLVPVLLVFGFLQRRLVAQGGLGAAVRAR